MKYAVCKGCGGPFVGVRHQGQRYCSDQCRPNRYIPGPTISKICQHCGNSFSTSRPNRKIYCSHKCALIANGRRYRKYLACKTCGKPFDETRKNAQVYCSAKCKATNSSLPCRECGKPTVDSRINQLCVHCSIKHTNRLRSERSRAKRLSPHACRVCGLVKEPEKFHRHEGLPSYLCKACHSRATSIYHRSHRKAKSIRFSEKPCIVCNGLVELPRKNFCKNCAAELVKRPSPRDLVRMQLQNQFEQTLREQMPKSFDLLVELFEPKICIGGRNELPFTLRSKIPAGYKEARQLKIHGLMERIDEETARTPLTPKFKWEPHLANWPLIFTYALYLETNRIIAKLEDKKRPGSGFRRKHKI